MHPNSFAPARPDDASPISGHPEIMKPALTNSADKGVHVNARNSWHLTGLFGHFPRLAVVLLATAFTLPTLAQQRPADLEPIPVPPPPPMGLVDAPSEPQVTIVRRGPDRVEEYRLNGKLYMMKVTPAGGGPSYYLIDKLGNGNWSQHDSLESGLRVPMWVIGTF